MEEDDNTGRPSSNRLAEGDLTEDEAWPTRRSVCMA